MSATFFPRLREDIACVFERDPAARSTWEVVTCYPGFHALVMHRWSHWLWGHRLRWLEPKDLGIDVFADFEECVRRPPRKGPHDNRRRHGPVRQNAAMTAECFEKRI